MKTFISLVLLLAPLPQLRGALVFPSETLWQSERVWAEEAHVEETPAERAVSLNNAISLNNQGSQLYAAGNYGRAEKILLEALRLQQAAPEHNTAALASTLFNLAAIARMQSRLPEAEALYHRSIAVRESISGVDSPDLGHALAGLAMVYMAEGRTADAMELAARAVRVNNSADVRNTLGSLLMTQGENAKAETLEHGVVEELKQANATRTRDYVSALTNLGTSRLRQANYGQAEVDLREAEASALLVVGDNHQLLATIWNNLAKVRAARGDWNHAEALFNKAIATWRSTLGSMHPDVADALSNMAALEESRKRYPQAQRLYRQALEIDQASLGADSLKVANDWNNLGALSVAQRHVAQAQSEFEKGLAIAEKRVGMEHPDSALIAVNLAVVYHAQKKYAEATVLLGKAIPVKERLLAPDSTELACILKLYASSQSAVRIATRDARRSDGI